MYREYFDFFNAYSPIYGPKTAIFLLVGKFYEMYDLLDPVTGEGRTTMRAAAELLRIQITIRREDGPKKESGLFAGVPEASLHKYAQILTGEGWTVVVVDQIKDEAGDVVKRSPSRILSPGTHVESADSDALWTAAIWMEWQEPPFAPVYAVSFLDPTTGCSESAEGKASGTADSWATDELLHLLQIYAPKEVIFLWRGPHTALPEESTLKSRLGLLTRPTTGFLIRHATKEQQGAFEQPFAREEFLRSMISTPTMLPLHTFLSIQPNSLMERSLCAAVRWLEDHFPNAPERLSRHTPIQLNLHDHTYLGNNILEQINIIPTTRGSSASHVKSVLGLFDRCLTPMGKRALRGRILNPSSNLQHIHRRLEEVEWCYSALQNTAGASDTITAIKSSLRGIYDIARIHHLMSKGSLSTEQILQLDQSYEYLQDIAGRLGYPFEQPVELQTQISSYLTAFRAAIDANKAARATGEKGSILGFLTTAVGPKTAAIEQEAEQLLREWKKKLTAFLYWAQLNLDSLKFEYRDDTWILRGSRQVLNHIEKKSAGPTASESPFTQVSIQVRKSTPNILSCAELSAFQDSYILLKQRHAIALQEESCDVFDALWKQVITFESAWLDWISRVDQSIAIAQVSREFGFTRPIIQEGSRSQVAVKGLFHPLLFQLQTRVEYVKHDVSIGEKGWLVYGVNASGKSSLMKALGIAVLLAQAGCFVPASQLTLTPFGSVFSRIWSQDNLWAGLSSFAVEMSELRDIVRMCGPRSLILGDEVCSGTESQSATALVGSTLKWLSTRKSCFMFATHLHDLLKLPGIDTWADIYHLRVGIDSHSGKLIYDRRLYPGPGSSTYGLEVARAMDLPLELMDDAIDLRRRLGGEVDSEGAAKSSWNTALTRKSCEVCSHPIARDLEVHHITPRSQGGSNALRNLIVVCQICHDKHHAGELAIAPLQQTSEGLQRLAAPTTPILESKQGDGEEKTVKKGKWSEEQLSTAHNTIKQFSLFPAKRIVFELKKQGVEMSEATVRKLRSS
jgi:DNA mismatch repair protein MutS